ncbi:MAG: transporter substrate-binding domain-containing protein [Pseudomonadota bacterium]
MSIFLDNFLTRRLTWFMARFLAQQKNRCWAGYTARFLARAGAFSGIAGRSAVLAAGVLSLVFVAGAPSQPAVAQSGPALNSLTGEGSEPPAGEATDNPTANLAVLRFVTGDDFPPFHYRDEDNVLTGFNVDVARAICLQLDLTCDIKVRPWEKLMDALDDNSADAVIASLAQTPATVSRATFTDPYYFTPARFAANLATQLKDMSVIGLEGATVGVVRDTAHEAYLRTFFKDTIIKRFDTAELARAALKRNQIPLLFGDGISLTFWLHGTSSSACCDFRGGAFGDPQFFGPGVAIALSQGAPDLKLLLNQAIGDVRRSGRLEELFLRYFPLRVY